MNKLDRKWQNIIYRFHSTTQNRFDPNIKFRKEGKINLLNTIEKTINALDFDAITIMTMGDNEGAKNKKHVDNRILESDMKTNSKYTKKCKLAQRSYNLIVHWMKMS